MISVLSFKRRGGWGVFSKVLLLAALLLATVIAVRPRFTTARASYRWRGSAYAQAKTDAGTYVVRRDEIKKYLLLDGELRAVRSRSIFATLSQEVKITYLPPEGSMVKVGDRLVELDSGTILDKIKDLEERIVAAENEIVKTSSTQESALREMEVELSTLWLTYEQAKVKAKVPADLIARREYQENQLALEKAKTEYENQLTKMEQKRKEQAAELQVKVIEQQKLEVQLKEAKGTLDSMNIKSPAEGMVIYTDHWEERRKFQIGDMVWSGIPLVTLPDLKEMEILAQVNEVDGPRLAIGQKAKIRLDGYPDKEISGAIKDIAQTAVRASWRSRARIFKVVISMDETLTEIMKPGMSAQVSIVVAEHGLQLLVPRSAVKFESGGAKVTRVEGEKERRALAVTIVATDPVFYAVAENGALKAGDQIVN